MKRQGAMVGSVLGAFLLGAAASLAVVIVVALATRPKLILSLGRSIPVDHLRPQYRFVHVAVKNRLWRVYKWHFTRPATFCRAIITVGDRGTTAPRFTFDGRWITHREPHVVVGDGRIATDPGLALTIPREHLVASEEAEVAIALKHDGDSACYAFSNPSYLHWSCPGFVDTSPL